MKRTFLVAILIGCCMALPAAAQRGRGGAPAGPTDPFAKDAQAIQAGQTIYETNCTQCHGINGAVGAGGPALAMPTGPNPRGSDGQLFNAIRNGTAGTLMAAWTGKLSDDDIWRVVSYLDALRGTAIDNPLPGNAAHGEEVFWGKGQCSSCHIINGRGGLTGPDLSNIASIRKSASIIAALTVPLHHVYGGGGTHLTTLPAMDSYPPVHVTMADGKVINGVLMNQDSFSLQMMGDDEKLHLFDRAKVRKVLVEDKSRMPTDYDKRLAPDEFKDLLAFLTRQGKPPTPAAAGGRRGAAGAAPPGD